MAAKVKRQNPEARIQVALCNHLRWRAKPDCFWFAVPNGGSRNVIEASHLKDQGVRAGVPDMILICGGRTYGLELKADQGRVSVAQHATQIEMEMAGAAVATAYGLDAALAQVEKWGLMR